MNEMQLALKIDELIIKYENEMPYFSNPDINRFKLIKNILTVIRELQEIEIKKKG